jgi:dipeptidyl aminopeptidase/acylaminoacyl peptidase
MTFGGPLAGACCVLMVAAGGQRIPGAAPSIDSRVIDARIAPDGGSVVYVLATREPGSPQPRERIWRVPFGGGDPRPLTSAAASASHPRWSPDGRRIAFLSRGATGRGRIVLVPASGGEPRALAPDALDVLSFDWSRDGRRIGVTVSRGANVSAFRVLDVASGRLQPLAFQGSDQVTAAAWAPSGSALAAVAPAPGAASRARIVAAALSEPGRELVSDAGSASGIAWSPDGELIAWLDGGDSLRSTARVMIVRAAGGEARALAGGRGSPVALARAGSGRLSITVEGSGERHVDTVDVRTGDRVTVFPPGIASAIGAASWSFDGARYVVVGSADDSPADVFAGSMPIAATGRDTVGAPPPPVRRVTFSGRQP